MFGDSSLVTVGSGRADLALLDFVSLISGVVGSFRTRSGIHLSLLAVVTRGALHFVSDIHFADTVVTCVTEGATSFGSSSSFREFTVRAFSG